MFGLLGLLSRGIPPERTHALVAVVSVRIAQRAVSVDVAHVVRVRRSKPYPRAVIICARARVPLHRLPPVLDLASSTLQPYT